MTKHEILKSAIVSFKDSKQTPTDYMDFIIEIQNSINDDTGLMLTEVENIVNECITVDVPIVEPYQGVQTTLNVKHEPGNIHSRIVQFCDHHRIKSVGDLAKVLAPMVYQMSLCDDVGYDGIEYKFILLMHQYNLTSNLTHTISDQYKTKGDMISVTIAGYKFYILDSAQNFIDISKLNYDKDLFYNKESLPLTAIDYTFKRHMDLFTNINSLIKYITKEA